MKAADYFYEVESKLLIDAKKKGYEEYGEFKADDQEQQLIFFSADKEGQSSSKRRSKTE
jgi:hypothetical protein